MIISEKINNFLCKFLTGHKFGGYEITDRQSQPEYFFCKRCKKVLNVKEGWN